MPLRGAIRIAVALLALTAPVAAPAGAQQSAQSDGQGGGTGDVVPQPVIGVIDLHRKVIEGEITASDYQRAFYEGGAVPSAVINVDRDWSPQEIAEFKTQWMHKLRGKREPIVLPADITATPFGITNADAQFIESRNLSLVDIANMVGVPAHYLGWSGHTRTYANTQDERRDLLDIYLRASLYAIERALTSVLPVSAKFNADTFLRLDAKGTAEVMAIESRWMTLDELRAVKGLPPLPDGRGAILGAEVFTQSSEDKNPAPQTQGSDSE